MIKRFIPLFLTLPLSVILLAGCQGDVREQLGLKKQPPNEFKVLSRPSLVVPPDLNSLPSPTDYQQPFDPNEVRDAARSALIGGSEEATSSASEKSSGESLLLKKAGASEANPEIRKILTEESIVREEKDEEKSVLDKILAPIRPDEDREVVIDADKEEERIRQNESENKPVNEGDVPVIDKRKGGILNL